ncbi:hypothetical protein KAT63_02990 [Candidatus Parcubacteria bacterium]|nr:hypothetical protein [Candidatus Parcubacteria bacterium]
MPTGIDVSLSDIEFVNELAGEIGITLEKEESPFGVDMITVYPCGSEGKKQEFFNSFWKIKKY